jgi:alkylated DNA nucleotide flippase Atl1
MKKTWLQKLHTANNLPRVEKIKPRQFKRWGKGTIAIPAPIEIDALMRKVRRGRTTTINELRTAIAKKHKATIGCPITTGIFAWISAYAAEEAKTGTPWWRTLKNGGKLNPKYPGGVKRQRRLLEREGRVVYQKGSQFFVKGVE